MRHAFHPWSGSPAARPGPAATALPRLARHDLVWLDPAASLRTEREADRALAAAWACAGRPFVVRREEAASAPDTLPLGLPLPSRLDRRRIALAARRDEVRRSGHMPLLTEACEAAFSGWRRPLRRLAAQLTESGASVRVYGSLGWQYLTGEAYLHPASDIDLLIEPGEEADTERLLALLSEARAGDCPRLDGEIALASDRMVAWRELFTATPEVLVRGLDGVALVPREAVRRLLRPGVAAC
ncbi:malonate decarboxylase holo-[acyl-carrier-protein] synthase [Starkeya koreensis]|uniref:Malonate decarboxylase holo-[acyl-carrier-protein] synthase n=1 Tax=Ancylobacter koreensis TaxID=266121 RepID=A0ABT0DKF7_9HYPH|nr:malonate decarboxylase holo-[acyl-carrier-protein] synthase [Ancylobacter koreensis]MCK0207756.1 malonate decarboxylase holo-[acyl-carrier-protein] synthase [Ancylobacter koreensis]